MGFMVVERFAKEWGIPLRGAICRARVGEGLCDGEPVRVALPQTSMNLSGESVQGLRERWRAETLDLLVVCDDVSLPLGNIRLRGQGSDGGHRGLASILEAVGSKAVPRLRVGIASETMGEDLIGFVLDPFKKSEEKTLEKALIQAVEACEVWMHRGLSAAMNLFNTRKK